MPKGLLIDITKCVGCEECERACSERNKLSGGEESRELTATNLTVVKEFNHGETYVRNLCMHCLEPTCVSACLVGAFTKTSLGAVVYDEEKCIGCRYCMQACPFEVPKYEWESLAPRVQKCSMCYETLREGGSPACAEACLFGATLFGERDDLVREAQKRIEENPEVYIDHIYGLTEAGGTSVLFLSGVPFAELGFPTGLPEEPIPKLSWRILKEIPRYAVVSGLVLYGIHWITARRAEVARAESEAKRRTHERGSDE